MTNYWTEKLSKVRMTRASSLRIIIPVVLTFILFFLCVFQLFIPSLESHLMEKKRETLQSLNDTAWSLISVCYQQVVAGALDTDAAKAHALKHIRGIRYGREEKDYFWVNDLHPTMLMHPYRPDLEGQDLTDFKDPAGKRLFVEFVKTVQTSGSGYVDYMWQWKDDPNRIAPKISFVKEFKPWGWVIGTGMYADDVHAEILSISNNLIKIFIAILAIALTISLYIIRETLKDEKIRRETEKALISSEKNYRLLADNIIDIIWVIDLATMCLSYVSPSIRWSTGFSAEESIGKKLQELVTPASMELATIALEEEMAAERKKLFSSKSRILDLEQYHKNGSIIYTETTTQFLRDKNGTPVSILGVSRDISERKELEAQLRQSQKMESIGTLTGGIAHDFNNIMGIIIGNTELALESISEKHPVNFNLEEIRSAGLRAADIVKQLLSFCRKSVQELKPVNLRQVIEEPLGLLRSTIPATIEIRKRIRVSDATILADPIQINQIIINLCINASQAMEQTGGIIDISLSNVKLSKAAANLYADLPRGDYIKLTVSDTGPGIEADIIDKVFDPYFTTKEIGKGSGMGLSIVMGIVKNHNGAIFIESEPGSGATFTILFPLTTDQIEIEAESAGTLPSGSESILLVDDDKAIAHMAQLMLISRGYIVEAICNPEDALKKFRDRPEAFDLIITDMTMPQMTGVALFERVKKIRPDIPVIICSGYNALISEQESGQMGIDAYLNKPFQMAELASAVRTVLDGQRKN
jgi:PAS domain S-box-containing protein